MKKILINNIEKLEVEVNVIGYHSEGESQIVIIRDGSSGKIYFSCVIDCFESDHSNQTKNILEEEGIKELDLLIWTHTDEDHSIGIDTIINRFGSDETNYFLPEFVNGSENDMVDYNDRIKNSLELINSKNVGTKYKVDSVSVVSGYTQKLKEVIFQDSNSGEQIPFSIVACSPISSLLRRRFNKGNKVKKNDFSIATIFTIGNVRLFFTSDIEDQTIRQIPQDLFQGISYLKTPHHTSSSSTLLLSYIDQYHSKDKILSTTTTTFKKFNLPDHAIISKYIKYSESFISTGSGKNNFGVIKTVFNVYDSTLVDEEIFGDCQSFIL